MCYVHVFNYNIRRAVCICCVYDDMKIGAIIQTWNFHSFCAGFFTSFQLGTTSSLRIRIICTIYICVVFSAVNPYPPIRWWALCVCVLSAEIRQEEFFETWERTARAGSRGVGRDSATRE